MKTSQRFALSFALLPTCVFAVYAPIPEQEQGKALTYRLGTSVYYDSNIFGAATGEISSMVYNLNGAISFNGSLDDQTFASAGYDISDDYQTDRPDKQNLLNQTLNARLAHSFSSETNIDLSGLYNDSENPQALLNGVPVNTDQSLRRAQVDGRFTTTAGPKTGVVVKYRYINYDYYKDASLGRNLNHDENLAGLELSYAYLPETKLVGEYRYQTINYRSGSDSKDKTDNFLMGGMDYNPGKNLSVSARFGVDDRKYSGAGSTTGPYVELSSHYNYAEGSFLAAGYSYTVEEPSDILNYTDSDVNRFFVNLQHRLTGNFYASGSLTYESAILQGRGGVHVDINENTTRFGLGLSWQPNKNWSAGGTYDLDDVRSDDPNRSQNRSRLGVYARYTF